MTDTNETKTVISKSPSHFAILRAHGHTDRLPVALYVRNDDRAATS